MNRNLVGELQTRKDLQSSWGKKGKELTQAIKDAVRGGVVVPLLRHVDPAHSAKRQRCYALVAQQQSLL